MRKNIFVFIVFSLFLVGCDNNTSYLNNSIPNNISTSSPNTSTDVIGESKNEIVEFKSEEEQFEKSDLVILIKAHGYGEVVSINNNPHTIYYFSILEFYKGDEEINHAYFFGNTTPTSNVWSSTDEKLIEGEEYKLYLRKKDNKYITTAGFQSIIKQEK